MLSLAEQGRMRPGSDGRRTGRVSADLPVRIYGSSQRRTLPARTRDLGAGGLCIATPSAFVLKSVRRVTIDLPSGPLTLPAEGRWQCDAPADGVVLSGLAFVTSAPDALEPVSRLVFEIGRSLAQFFCTRSELRGIGLEQGLGLAHITRFREVKAGGTIYRQGTARAGEDSIFVVGRGQVIVQVRVRGVTEVMLARLGPGQIFGGMPLLGGVDHCDSAVAETDARILEIDRDSFGHLKVARPPLAEGLAFAVLDAYQRRLDGAVARLRDPV